MIRFCPAEVDSSTCYISFHVVLPAPGHLSEAPKFGGGILAVSEKNFDVLNTQLIENFTYQFFHLLKIYSA